VVYSLRLFSALYGTEIDRQENLYLIQGQNENMEIKIGIGLDDIIFGMYLKDVTAIVGKADKIVCELEGISVEKEVAHYFYRQMVKMNFNINDRLCSIKVFNPNAIMYNQKIMGKNKSEILDLLKTNGCIKFEEDNYDLLETIWCNEIAAEFGFEFNRLKSIDFNILFDKNDKEIWPAENALLQYKERFVEIKAGIGLDDVVFGMSQDDVKVILGEPDKISEIEIYDGTVDWIVYYYNSQLIEVKFELDTSNDWKLQSIVIHNSKATMFNERIIGKNKNETIELLRENGYCDIIQKDYESFETIFCKAIRSTFSFKFDRLTDIEFSPIYDDDGVT